MEKEEIKKELEELRKEIEALKNKPVPAVSPYPFPPYYYPNYPNYQQQTPNLHWHNANPCYQNPCGWN